MESNNIEISDFILKNFDFNVQKSIKKGFFKSLTSQGSDIKLSFGNTIDKKHQFLFYSFEKSMLVPYGSFILLDKEGEMIYEPDLGFDFPEKRFKYEPNGEFFIANYVLQEEGNKKIIDTRNFELAWDLVNKKVWIEILESSSRKITSKMEGISKHELQSISNVDKLKALSYYLEKKAIKKTYEGDPYGLGYKWRFYHCYFYEDSVRKRFKFSDTILTSCYDGRMAGSEFGFYDKESGFGVMGIHKTYVNKETPKIFFEELI